MKTLMKTTFSAVALLLALPACAQDAPAPVTDADPALWVVKDADTTVYLFGTIHLLKPGLSCFDEAVKTEFERSGEIVLEMVQPDQATQMRVMETRGVAPTGPALSEQLPADYRSKLAAALPVAGLPAPTAERMKPWLVSMAVGIAPLMRLGYAPANGPEEVLAAAAKAAGKPVGALETFEQQIGFFDGVSQPNQVKLLTATLDELPTLEATMGKMVADWSRGDPEPLAAEITDQWKEVPEVQKALLTDRNARWATWVQERMAKPGVVFVAVGAGHLAGPESVQAMLGKAGVKATRVKY